MANTSGPQTCPRCKGHGATMADARSESQEGCYVCNGWGKATKMGDGKWRPYKSTKTVLY